jgi:hypothetical protein
MIKKFPIRYTSKDFDSIKSDLVEYSKKYYSDTFRDFSDASFGSLMLDSVAYVGDILSFIIDYQTNETFLNTALEQKNIFRLADQLGYKYNFNNSSVGQVSIYILVPANAAGTGPDYDYAPIVRKNTVIGDTSNLTQFILTDDVDFNDKNLDVRVAKVNTNTGNPSFYAIKSYASVISGIYGEETIEVSNFTKFPLFKLAKENINEIISVTDSEGNEYHEVDYLTQNIVYKKLETVDGITGVSNTIMIPYVANRRFATEFDGSNLYLRFGGGRYADTNSLRPDLLAEPSRKVLQMQGAMSISDKYLDPYSLIENDNLGLAPENTKLTVKYRYNITSNINIQSGALRAIKSLNIFFRNLENLSPGLVSQVYASIEVTNAEPITKGFQKVSTQELKQNVLSSFHMQNRIVTQEDYEAACYNIPTSFASVKRAKAHKNNKNNKNNIDLYVISEDVNGNLLTANSTTKNNLKKWLNKGRIITDTVEILDAKIINVGINFSILTDPNYLSPTVLNTCIEQLIYFYSIAPQIGQPIYITDIYKELRKVRGLLDVRSVEIVNLAGGDYSNIVYDIKSHISADGRYVYMPKNGIFEFKKPRTDIKGTIV